MKITIVDETTGQDIEGRSIHIEVDDHEAFVDRLLPALESCFGDQGNNGIKLYSVLAQPALTPVSRVRQYKGFSKLYLSESPLAAPPIVTRDGCLAIREGMDLLYTVATGPPCAARSLAHLGIWHPGHVLVCARELPPEAAFAQIMTGSVVISDKNTVALDHRALFRSHEATLCAVGSVSHLPFVVRIGICATAQDGFHLLTTLAAPSAVVREKAGEV